MERLAEPGNGRDGTDGQRKRAHTHTCTLKGRTHGRLKGRTSCGASNAPSGTYVPVVVAAIPLRGRFELTT